MTLHQAATRMASAGMATVVLVHAWALLGAVWHLERARRRARRPFRARELARALLPPEILRSRWTRLDVMVFALHPLFRLGVFQVALGLAVGLAAAVAHGLGMRLRPAPLPAAWWTQLPFLALGLLVRDFATFYVHYLQHKIPLLWEFHKVHHAPETLVPVTTRRLHPLDELLGLLAEAVLVGVVVGVQAWATGLGARGMIDAGAVLYAAVNVLAFAPLRHSHIDLRLGRAERLLLSPAHHQIHHSVEREHWDRNFGAVLPVWDRLWGTLLEPLPHGTFRLGLPDGESERYVRLRDVYLEPLRRSRGFLPGGRQARKQGSSFSEEKEAKRL